MVQTKTEGLETESWREKETEVATFKVYTSVFCLQGEISAFPMSNCPLDGISNEEKKVTDCLSEE